VIEVDALPRQVLATQPVALPEIAALRIQHGRRTMLRVAVARTPLEQAVVVGRAAAQVPAVRSIAEAAPERDLLEGGGVDRRVATEHLDDTGHLLGPIELVDVDLPQVVARCAGGVGPALLVLLARPE